MYGANDVQALLDNELRALLLLTQVELRRRGAVTREVTGTYTEHGIKVTYDPLKHERCTWTKGDQIRDHAGCSSCHGTGIITIESTTFAHINTLFKEAGITPVVGTQYLITFTEVK